MNHADGSYEQAWTKGDGSHGHANWNAAATPTIMMNNYNAGNSIGMGTEGTTVGVQVEAWWNENWW